MVQYKAGDVWVEKRLNPEAALVISGHSSLDWDGLFDMKLGIMAEARNERPEAPEILGRIVYWRCGHLGNYFFLPPIPELGFGLYQITRTSKWEQGYKLSMWDLSSACRSINAWSIYQEREVYMNMPRTSEQEAMIVFDRLLGDQVTIWR